MEVERLHSAVRPVSYPPLEDPDFFKGKGYIHSGSFVPQPGGVYFQFLLKDIDTGDGIVYRGIFRDGGKDITYSRTMRDPSERVLDKHTAHWKSPKLAE